MSKWLKRLLGLTALASAVAGAIYVFKKFDESDDELDDVFEDEDFDLDDDLKPVSDREYVALTPNASDDVEEEEKEEDTAEEEVKEEVKEDEE